MVGVSGAHEAHDALGGFEAFVQPGHQRHAHAARAGVVARVRARQQAAGQNGHIVLGQQQPCEVGVVTPFGATKARRHLGPQVKPGVRQAHVHDLGQPRRHALELGTVQRAVGLDVGLVGPGCGAGLLHRPTHRAAVVGAVQRESAHDGRITRDETAAQPWGVAALGQARQHDQAPKIVPAQRRRRLQRAQRRVVAEVDFAVALVAGDDKAKAVAQLEQATPLVQRHHRPGRVARGAGVHQLRARPDRLGHAVPIGGEVACGVTGRVPGLGARQQRRAFVNLIKRVGAHDHRLGALRERARVHHHLRQGKQRLARAQRRQHLGGGVRRHAVATPQPGRARRLELGRAGGRGVRGQAGRAVDGRVQRLGQHRRGRVARLTNAQVDRGVVGVGGDAGGQRPPTLKRVGLQPLQQGVASEVHGPQW